MTVSMTLIARLGGLWEAWQVELSGRYSIQQLLILDSYVKETSLATAVAIILATPVPSIAIIAMVEALPFQPPNSGLENQTIAYWVRMFVAAFFISGGTVVQWQNASPSLSLSTKQLVGATTVIALVTQAVFFGLHMTIGFPTPFLFQVVLPPWNMIVGITMWVLWKDQIRGHPETQADLKQFQATWSSQVAMAIIYPVLTYLFTKLSRGYQAVSTIFLPIMKLALKNWSIRGTHRVYDLAPVYVVFTVDVFHSLFLSCAMQSSMSGWTLGIVMLVDLFQGLVALFEVLKVESKLRTALKTIASIESAQIRGGGVIVFQPNQRRCILSDACAVLEADPILKDHQLLANIRLVSSDRFASRQPTSVSSLGRKIGPVTTIVASNQAGPVQSRGKETSLIRSARLDVVKNTLRLLHMVEFYVLIEFTEVVVAVVYCTLACLSTLM